MSSSFSSRHKEPAHELMPGHVLQKTCRLVSSSWWWASWGGHGVGNRLESGDRIQEAVRDVLHWRSFHRAVSAASVEGGLAALPDECGR
jgi:hypothetical protein